MKTLFVIAVLSILSLPAFAENEQLAEREFQIYAVPPEHMVIVPSFSILGQKVSRFITVVPMTEQAAAFFENIGPTIKKRETLNCRGKYLSNSGYIYSISCDRQ